jgi:hypothetical protein
MDGRERLRGRTAQGTLTPMADTVILVRKLGAVLGCGVMVL